MTTQRDGQPVTWESLTENEQLCLKGYDRNPKMTGGTIWKDSLVKKGLVTWEWVHGGFLTDAGRAVLATAPQAGSGDVAAGEFKKGDRVLWIPHNHTGYISEVDERDGLPCYYLELDMTDETGYAKHESLRLVGEDYLCYPREKSEVEKLREELAALRSRAFAACSSARRLREALESVNSIVLDAAIKTGDKDEILDVIAAALAAATPATDTGSEV